jgi:NAD(P)-dependent dehydrogenase (short-subunit alcohol dehydrogenase family)
MKKGFSMQVSSLVTSSLRRNKSNRKKITFKPARQISVFSLLDFFNTGSTFKLPIERVNTEQKGLRPLAGKVVLVTGGSRGIGKAACEYFAQEGCIVFGTSRTPERVSNMPPGCTLLKLDVRSNESVKKCIDEIIACHGRIEILINNAGIGQYGRLIKATVEDLNAVFATNLFGVHRVTVAAYPHMQRPDCRIITMGSLEGETGYPYQALYSASKRALQIWNDSFDFEQRNENGPRFTLLEPSWVNTGFGISQDIVNTEPGSSDLYARKAQELFPLFLKKYGIEPSEVAKALYTIAAMPKPQLRYFIGIKGALFMGQSLEDMLKIVYTQSPESRMALFDAITKIAASM